MAFSSKSLSICIVLTLLVTYFGVSSGLQCLNCQWMDVTNGDQFECKTANPSNSQSVTVNEGQVGYCFTITGTRDGVVQGIRGFHVYTNVTDPKYTQGQCMDHLPQNVTVTPGLNGTRSCLCNDKDNCNSGDNSNGAIARFVVIGILPTLLLSLLTISL